MLFQYSGSSMLGEGVRSLVGAGLIDIILPFALFFAIIFSILQMVKIFKKGENPNKAVNAIVALAISLLMIIPHIINPSPNDLVNIINNWLPGVGFILIAIVLVFLVSGMLAGGASGQKIMGAEKYAFWVALVLVLITFLVNVYPHMVKYRYMGWLYIFVNPLIQSAIVAIAVFALIIWLVVRGE